MRTKQSAGNLPDGSAFLVGNPVKRRSRYPLVVTLSEDGRVFDRAWLLRAGGDALQPLRYPGRYKRSGYSYAKSAVIGGWLYVAYATNKEDIEITRVPVDALAASPPAVMPIPGPSVSCSTDWPTARHRLKSSARGSAGSG